MTTGALPYQLPELQLMEANDPTQLGSLVRAWRFTPQVIRYYLTQVVFPEVMQSQSSKLQASGIDLGGDMMFATRLGFSGTPSDMLPREFGRCGTEPGSDAKMVRVLTDSATVSCYTPTQWSVTSLLDWVARSDSPRFHVLVSVLTLKRDTHVLSSP